MSTSRSIDDSSSTLNSSRTVSIRSSYFQTEFSGYCEAVTSDIETNVACGVSELSIDDKEKKSHGLSNHPSKTVCVSVQAERNIIGKEDTIPRRIKCSVRPPVDGQASSNETNAVPVYQPSISSESDEDVCPNVSLRVKTKSIRTKAIPDSHNKKDNSDKTLEGSSDQSLPAGGELSDYQRIPTPSSVSSITSRPLEWDSGADVGYYQQYDSSHLDHELSSIERMALDQGRKGILVRSDPEGKSSSKKLKVNSTVLNMIGAPASESTPIVGSTAPVRPRNNNNSGQSKTSKNGRNQHLFPEVIIKNKGNQSDSSSDCATYSNKHKSSVEVRSLPAKKSSSLENLNEYRVPEQNNSTFPRSHSQINIVDETSCFSNPRLKNVQIPPQSLSSSSVATVVTGSPSKTSKCIQTSYHKNNVATQSSLLNPVKKSEESGTQKKREQNQSSTLESVQMTADDRVNSFEYLPGHVYENNQKSDDAGPWDNRGLSLREDVERGVHLLEEFIQGSNANNTLMKKELIQRVVKRLIQTDYPEDAESQNSLPLRCSTRRSQNRNEAIGESSSENVPASDNKTSGQSTSLSAQSSSVWLSVTESSKSSFPSDHKKTSPKSVPVTKKSTEENKKIPKSTTDYTSDTKSNWKAPATRAEKLYENKKGSKANGEEVILEFLNSEREKQLDWIVKEIDHLSSLKSLLEKHEQLRRNLQRLKKERQRNVPKTDDNVRATNHPRFYGFRRKPPFGADVANKHPVFPPTSQSSNRKPNEDETWDSHNYDTSDRLKLKKTVSTETRKEDIYGGKRSTAYTITFENPSKPKKKVDDPVGKPLIADRQTLAKESKEFVRETYHMSSLQDCLLAKRPEIVRRAEMRRKTVSELAAVRQLRQEKRPVVLAAALSSESQLIQPPPPPLVKRIVSQKEMRKQTEKKYKKTFEVQKKISERKLKESLKTNRLMADVYNKRLQLLTLKGRTDLSNSLDVIYTV